MRTFLRSCPVRGCFLAPAIVVVVAGCGSSGNAVSDSDGAVEDAAAPVEDAAAPVADAAARGGDATDGNDAALGSDTSAVQDAGSECPSSEPGAGTPCPVGGAYCSYGGGFCCGGAYTCTTGGTWQILYAKCACNVPPDAGGSCGGQACQTGTSCCGPPECGFCIPNGSGVQCASTCDAGSPDGGACPASCKAPADCSSCPQKPFGGWSCNGGTCQFMG